MGSEKFPFKFSECPVRFRVGGHIITCQGERFGYFKELEEFEDDEV